MRFGGKRIERSPGGRRLPPGFFVGTGEGACGDWFLIKDLIKNWRVGGADGSASDLRCGNGPLWRGDVGYRRASFP